MRLRGRLRPRPCVRNLSKTDRSQTRGAGCFHRPAPRGARAAAHERRSQRLRSGAAPAVIMPEQGKAFHAAGATEKQWIGKPPLLYACGSRLEGQCRRRTGECCLRTMLQANFTAEAQRMQRREELYVFVLLAFSGCSPLRWQPMKASRIGPKRKQSNPSPTARATIYMRDAFPARIARPHSLCKEEWAFVCLLYTSPSPRDS